jgi:hypothetical protein
VLAALLPGVVNNPPLTAAVPTGRILFASFEIVRDVCLGNLPP